ncbi:hypothetical protein CCACVL1_21447 [Corchorus capsularis]|uniref:Uncharacterized protein n=1 Tax=Corchorus capsularis TaxID=210143 RepID=A0A1R3H5N8_COCAP|nr:hypothetical protein CCACVL1_21447 [Corchorus capsularis]
MGLGELRPILSVHSAASICHSNCNEHRYNKPDARKW